MMNRNVGHLGKVRLALACSRASRLPQSCIRPYNLHSFGRNLDIAPCLYAVQVRHNSGFIRSVMEQVKRDIEKDPTISEQQNKIEQSGVKEWAETIKQKAQAIGSSVASTTSAASQKAKDVAGKTSERLSKLSNSAGGTLDSQPGLKKAAETIAAVAGKAKGGIGAAFDATSSIIGQLSDDTESKRRHAEWMNARRQETKNSTEESADKDKSADEEGATEKASESTEETPKDDGPVENAMVVSEQSAWERFGTRLRDMPFLNAFFENPLLGNLFGETEIAKSIRQMKTRDRKFRLADYHETVEHIIAPALVDAFLHGDEKLLKVQCGEVAWATVHASFTERKRQKRELDKQVLHLSGVELKGARAGDEDDLESFPTFVWTFKAQQINCLRDKDDNIVEGAIDDIREVHYAIALTKHPSIDDPSLFFPWKVEELAIVGSQPIW